MNEPNPTATHIPVLLDEVLAGLNPAPGKVLVDGTLGAGGHSAAWLEATAPDGRVIGFDRDSSAIATASHNLAAYDTRLTPFQASHSQMAQISSEQGFGPVDAVLLDLGYSSLQVDDPGRGFSFRHDAPLDMRYDREQPTSAVDLVNGLPEADLADLIFEFGEDRYSRRIAHAIVQARPVETTMQLAGLIYQAVPHSREKIHPATRTFQALRIAVNHELDELASTLPQAVSLLHAGGRLAVISFHSLEDRIVKQFIREEARDCLCPPEVLVCTCDHHASLSLVTRKPLVAQQAEIGQNPRARSAKLRIAEKREPGTG